MWLIRTPKIQPGVPHGLFVLVPSDGWSLVQYNQLNLLRGSRTCEQRLEPRNDITVLTPDGEWATLEYRLDPTFKEGDACDPDGEMDGGLYEAVFGAKTALSRPWRTAALGQVDLIGPTTQLRALTPDLSPERLVDDQFQVETSTMVARLQALWTDGVWRNVTRQTVQRREVEILYSPDGGTTTSTYTPRWDDRVYLGGSAKAPIPTREGSWQFQASGQTPSTWAALETIDYLERYDVTATTSSSTRVYLGQKIDLASTLTQKFEDGLWRPMPKAPYQLQFRAAGTSQWRTVKRDRTNIAGLAGEQGLKPQADGYWRVATMGKVSEPIFVDTRNGDIKRVTSWPQSRARLGAPVDVRAWCVNKFLVKLPDERLILQRAGDRRWITLDKAITGKDGRTVLTIPSVKRGVYRVVSPRSGEYDAFAYR